MSPQPAAPANQSGVSPQPAAPANQSGAARQIERAKSLEAERAQLQARIAANRTYLRLMADNDELTDEQEDWLDGFYPQKERGEVRSRDEIDRTRRLKEEARKAA